MKTFQFNPPFHRLLPNLQHQYDHQICLNFLNEFVQELENREQDPENPLNDLFCETARELRTNTITPRRAFIKSFQCACRTS